MQVSLQPHFHFYPRENWMNDPNGLVYYEGEYHLFYQCLWPRHWGHAVSTDLMHWQILPMALIPDALGDIWSGSVVVDQYDSSGFFDGAAGLVAIFTHQNSGQQPPNGPQVQSLAYSVDGGRSWVKYAHNPVLPNPGVADFRDPKVFWHESTRRWVMVVTYHDDRVRIYTSPNLKQWTYGSEFGVGQGAPVGVWECPDLFELPVDGDHQQTRWVLHVSLYTGQESMMNEPAMQYFLGTFDGTTFTNIQEAATVCWSEYGMDNYAAVTWSDVSASDGRRLSLGWMSNWKYAHLVPTHGWQGMMTVPRVLHLKTYGPTVKLVQQPVKELQLLRQDATHWSNLTIEAGVPVLLPVAGDALEIIAVFQPGTASSCGLSVRIGEGEQTLIGYEADTATIFVDRSSAGDSAFHAHFPAKHAGPITLYEETVTLHIFIDRYSVEVFGNEGEGVITDLIFPRPESTGVALFALHGVALLRSLDVYHLQTIWDTN